MKSLAILVATATFFVLGISAFAYGGQTGSNSTFNPAAYQNQSVVISPQSAGITSDQLVKQMGKPDSISASANGHTIYTYETVGQYGPHDRTTRWTFDIAPDGTVVSENASIS